MRKACFFSERFVTKKNEEIRYLRRKCRMRLGWRGVEFSRFRWLELVIAGTCVDLLTDRGIFTRGNEERIEREDFFGVKIVNAVLARELDNFGNEGKKIGHSELTTKRTKGRNVFLCRLACFCGEGKVPSK
jgi:hypothetical protein